jgi:hypothetical protein
VKGTDITSIFINNQMDWQTLVNTVQQHYSYNKWALIECQSILARVEELKQTDSFCKIFDKNLAYPSLHTTLVSTFDDLIANKS